MWWVKKLAQPAFFDHHFLDREWNLKVLQQPIFKTQTAVHSGTFIWPVANKLGVGRQRIDPQGKLMHRFFLFCQRGWQRSSQSFFFLPEFRYDLKFFALRVLHLWHVCAWPMKQLEILLLYSKGLESMISQGNLGILFMSRKNQ